MKIEKIDENKIRITLSFEELENRNVTLRDIESNNKLAKELFADLIEESNVDEYLEAEDSQLFIEASADNNNTLFMLTVTKIEDIPDINKYVKNSQFLLCDRLDYRLFEFKSLDRILDFCETTKDENLYFGTNSLYKYNEKYFILFGKAVLRNKKFVKTCAMLSEYSTRYFSYDLYYTAITEKSELMIKNRALQKLSTI